MVVTSRFHQLRSYLTFRCAVRQRPPHERPLQARPLRGLTVASGALQALVRARLLPP